MPLIFRAHGAFARIVASFLIVVFSLLPQLSALAQQSTPAPGAGITWRICESPATCFVNQAAKDKFASDHNCRFLEDVCSKGSIDNQGAKPEDEGFWGSLWSSVKGSLVYGYEFVKGLLEGLKNQITDIIELVTNLGSVVGGLIDLGKAFYNNPKETIEQLGQLLGQGAVDTLTKASQCGPYDLGKVIGGYVSPAIAIKVATKLTKYGGNVAEAVKQVKIDVGCASFAAGTAISTPDGMVPVEAVRAGQTVFSRNDSSFHDHPRQVTQVFNRTAPDYRLLRTESETLRLTDEHPVWVQGKGWTVASEVREDDVIAGREGDSLVLDNTAVEQSLRVYNFSVAGTPSYFAGQSELWVHNAKCDLHMPYRAPRSLSGYATGSSDGGPGKWTAINRPDTAPYRFEKQVTGAPKSIEYEVGGVKFDGYDASRNVLLDAKNYTADNVLVKNEPLFLVTKMKQEAISEARRQLGVTKPPVTVEWHVSNKVAADVLAKLFAGSNIPDKDRLVVVFTPDIVN